MERSYIMSKVLVAYFSATGKTKKLAEQISDGYNLDIYEIEPKEKYTKMDLMWINPLSRTSKEHRNKDYLPEIVNSNANISEYDKVVICYPVWWFTAPTIIHTFLSKYDFSNKEILLFASSSSSGFGNVLRDLQKYVDTTCKIKEGKINPNLDEMKEIMDDFIK